MDDACRDSECSGSQDDIGVSGCPDVQIKYSGIFQLLQTSIPEGISDDE